MFENRVNNKDCRKLSVYGVEFDTETSRIKLPGFSPVRDMYLKAIVMLMFSSLN